MVRLGELYRPERWTGARLTRHARARRRATSRSGPTRCRTRTASAPSATTASAKTRTRSCSATAATWPCTRVRRPPFLPNRFLSQIDAPASRTDCAGVPYIPEGQWLCRKCTVTPDKPVVRVSDPLIALPPPLLTLGSPRPGLRPLPQFVRRLQADNDGPMGASALRDLGARNRRGQYRLHGTGRRPRSDSKESVEAGASQRPTRTRSPDMTALILLAYLPAVLPLQEARRRLHPVSSRAFALSPEVLTAKHTDARTGRATPRST